ncbi:cob(I)yrinic acid a,c-diamide adenosyltransferase [Geothermobacter hydrogeniphilus]|uniref:corrinoid adenosyltransferase n=1 Tax=Geothermobacter hydrogeniphilus TaxID=1969733 RepID=A0A1X0Y564_9BACT|nr:cob(I)yrinic acid a,c-diamide adenosyltransferase [Geothermobacter hydrogeniphilus]ORJ60269.1 hypothetical protein B5V00_08435 [Geothermobacter hydrogeniphilus]
MSADRVGLLQVYTGDGKGKTTAATGLLVRALGQGLRTLLVRFLKPAVPRSGELIILEQQTGLEIIDAAKGVIGRQVDPEEMRANVTATFDLAAQRLRTGDIELVVFDEIHGCLNRGYLDFERFAGFLDQRPAALEVVCTGRRAPVELLERADLVTCMQLVKHPHEQGIKARKGIEY